MLQKALLNIIQKLTTIKLRLIIFLKKINISDLLDDGGKGGESSTSKLLDIDKELADSKIALIEDGTNKRIG